MGLAARASGLLLPVAVLLGSGGCSAAPLDSPETISAPLPPLPRAEAGFVDVPHPEEGRAGHARLFYSFHAADERPSEKPLLVFFNGGPGSATSQTLLSFGTGRVTIDTSLPPEDCLVPNDRSFTRFANLLYVDERDVGFSYSVETMAAAPFDALADAADFLRVVLAFTEKHPAASRAGLGFVGESYGGTRATWMTHFLLHPNDAPAATLGLSSSIGAYLDRVLPIDARRAKRPEDVGRHLVGNVLIQPLVLGKFQWTAQGATPFDRRTSPYDVRFGSKELAELLDRRALTVLAQGKQRERLFEVPTSSIEGLLPRARPNGVRVASQDEHPEYGERTIDNALASELGSLAKGDGYYRDFIPRVLDREETASANAFLSDLRYVPIFMTNATYDRAIVSTAIVSALREAQVDATVDTESRPNVARPGWISVPLAKAKDLPARTVTVRFPTYEAGHMVTTTKGGELADDVRDWLAERVATASRVGNEAAPADPFSVSPPR